MLNGEKTLIFHNVFLFLSQNFKINETKNHFKRDFCMYNGSLHNLLKVSAVKNKWQLWITEKTIGLPIIYKYEDYKITILVFRVVILILCFTAKKKGYVVLWIA